ncbi:MAG: pseudouridine synthase, partial [Nitrosopumilaceae archaeon]
NFKKGGCEVRARPIFLSGRYTKSKREVPQKETRCEYCRGRGCYSCQFRGVLPSDSIEGKIAKFLIEKFGSIKAKVTWIGGEDETSLVLGKGRPFFVKLINPKKRKIKLAKKIFPGGVAINNLKIIEGIPRKAVRFISSVKLQISTEKEIRPLELKKLRNLKKNTILVHENSGKVNKKNVYDIKYKKLSKHSFILSMKVDGGLPLKRFIEGKNVIPNVSAVIRNHSKCEKFDFFDIQVTN